MEYRLRSQPMPWRTGLFRSMLRSATKALGTQPITHHQVQSKSSFCPGSAVLRQRVVRGLLFRYGGGGWVQEWRNVFVEGEGVKGPNFWAETLQNRKQREKEKIMKNESSQQKGDERGFQVLAQITKRRRTEDSNLAEICSIIRNVRSLRHMKPEIEQFVTDLVKRIVQEELESRILRLRPIINQTGTSFQLVFKNELPATIFTHSKIKAKDDKPIEIALYDTISKSIVTEGPLSYIKIEICVLNGEFGSNGSEDWSADEFKAKILRQREDKAHLLKGDTVITLKNGVGFITNILFTDNSRWTKSGRFRLGAKVMQTTSNEANIKEGRSKPFIVKHYRSEACKKHQCSSLNDEVWCLKKIKRNGEVHQQLSSNEIKTVKDLLQLYITNQVSLQKIIGRKAWDSIIEQAKACDIDDDKRYIYHSSAAEQSISLVFNCIYEVVDVSFNGQNYCSLESLNLNDKRLVERVKQQAYTNVKDNMIPLETTSHGLVETLASVQPLQLSATDQVLEQGQPETLPSLCEQTTSTSHIGEAEAHNYDHIGSDQLAKFGNMLLNWDQIASWDSPPNCDGAGRT